jgi:dihydroorotase
VCDGVIDVIVSAHRPLDVEEKNLPFGEAAFGSVGIETLLPTVLNLWHTGKCTLTQALKPVTCNPAKILKLPQGRLQKNCPADFVLIDLYKSWKLDRDDLKSRSHNSAFDGHLFEGKVIKTYIGGKEYIC